MRKFILIISIVLLLLASLSSQELDYDACRNLQPDGIHPELYSWYSGVLVGLSDIHVFTLEQTTELRDRLDDFEDLVDIYGDETGEMELYQMRGCVDRFRNVVSIRVQFLESSQRREPVPDRPETPAMPTEAYETVDPTAPDTPGVDIPDFYLTDGEDFTITERDFRTRRDRPVLDSRQTQALDTAAFEYISSKIDEVRFRNDSLRDVIHQKNTEMFKQTVAVLDTMRIYQQRIDELTTQIEMYRLDSLANYRIIVALEESLSVYERKNESLKMDNESLWKSIAENLEMIGSLNERIDSLELIISLLDRELMFKDHKLQKITPYSSAESFLKLSLRSNSRLENEEYYEDGSINLGGLGLHFRRKNIFGQYSFRTIELMSEANVFETSSKADFYAGGGLWMYPWMLPWLPYVIPGSKSVIDSTDFYLGMNYYYKSGVDYFDNSQKDLVSYKVGVESNIHYINTILRWYSTFFDDSYGYNVSSFGIQHRILKRPRSIYDTPEGRRPSTQFTRYGGQPEATEQRDPDKPRSEILMNFEFFATHTSNTGLSTPFNDEYESYLLFSPKKSEKTYIGAGITWGGNNYSFLPNLHRRLAENGRFDIMPIFPIQIDNIQMFGLYTYGNIDKEGKLSNFVLDAIYHLPSIPIFETPMVFRMGFYNDATGRWLTSSIQSVNPNAWYFEPADTANPIVYTDRLVPKRFFDFEIWFLFETMPIGITASLPEPLDKFPMEISIETFFNLR